MATLAERTSRPDTQASAVSRPSVQRTWYTASGAIANVRPLGRDTRTSPTGTAFATPAPRARPGVRSATARGDDAAERPGAEAGPEDDVGAGAVPRMPPPAAAVGSAGSGADSDQGCRFGGGACRPVPREARRWRRWPGAKRLASMMRYQQWWWWWPKAKEPSSDPIPAPSPAPRPAPTPMPRLMPTSGRSDAKYGDGMP